MFQLHKKFISHTVYREISLYSCAISGIYKNTIKVIAFNKGMIYESFKRVKFVFFYR